MHGITMVTGGVVVILLNNVYYPTVGSHSLQEVGSRVRVVGADFKVRLLSSQ